MNPYVEAGYVVVLGTLGTYAVALVARERAARRRVGGAQPAAGTSRDGATGIVAGAAGADEVAGIPAAGTEVPELNGRGADSRSKALP